MFLCNHYFIISEIRISEQDQFSPQTALAKLQYIPDTCPDFPVSFLPRSHIKSSLLASLWQPEDFLHSISSKIKDTHLLFCQIKVWPRSLSGAEWRLELVRSFPGKSRSRFSLSIWLLRPRLRHSGTAVMVSKAMPSLAFVPGLSLAPGARVQVV